MMSPAQLRQLGIAASAAVKHQRMVKALSAETMPPDLRTASASAQNEFWRHQQVALVTQRVCSFKEMTQAEYNPVMQHFEALAGPFWKGRAVKRTVKVIDAADCDRAPGCEYVRDVRHWMSKADFAFPNYCLPIMGRWRDASGERITDIRALRTWQLKELHDTVVNRCRAKLGLGEAANRNKKQRGQSGEQKAEPQKAEPQSPTASAPAKAREYILKPRAPRPANYVPNPEIEPF